MDRPAERVREGLRLYSADGHRMGRIVRRGPGAMEVEYGFFLPRDFVLHDEDVLEATEERVTSRLARAELLELRRRLYVLGDAVEGERSTGADSEA